MTLGSYPWRLKNQETREMDPSFKTTTTTKKTNMAFIAITLFYQHNRSSNGGSLWKINNFTAVTLDERTRMESFPTVAFWQSKAGKDSKEGDVWVLKAIVRKTYTVIRLSGDSGKTVYIVDLVSQFLCVTFIISLPFKQRTLLGT